MSIVALALTALFILGLVAAFAQKLTGKGSTDDTPVAPSTDCGTCDGSNSKCEQECMLEAAVKEIAGKALTEASGNITLENIREKAASGVDIISMGALTHSVIAFSEAEAEQFADILYTMQPEEVAAWNRSLILRGINIPDQIRDEMLLLLSDDRPTASNNPPVRQ